MWRAIEADDDLRRVFSDPDLDDRAWVDMAVPGHWRSEPAFRDSDGPVLHRRRFDAARPGEGRRMWLHLDGLFYQGDVWLDRSYLGDTEGYFAPHAFEVTDALRQQSEHVLAVEVTCARPTDRTAKRNLTGVFQHWDCIDPGWNPGGIWRPVHIEETGPVRIASLRVVCPEATAERAVLDVRAVLDSAQACTVVLDTVVRPLDRPAGLSVGGPAPSGMARLGQPATGPSAGPPAGPHPASAVAQPAGPSRPNGTPSSRWPPAPTRSPGASRSNSPGCGGPTPSATSPCTRSRSRCAPRS